MKLWWKGFRKPPGWQHWLQPHYEQACFSNTLSMISKSDNNIYQYMGTQATTDCIDLCVYNMAKLIINTLPKLKGFTSALMYNAFNS